MQAIAKAPPDLQCYVETKMNTYLFTWNPKKTPWNGLPQAVVQVNTGEDYYFHWSSGNRKNIQIGDTFFLMKLGVPPKGIIAVGQILSNPYSKPHFNKSKAREGKTALYVDLFFSHLSDVPIVYEKTLNTHKKVMNFNWFPEASGVFVPQHIADYMVKLIEKQSRVKYKPLISENLTKISEGKPKRLTITTYDRSPLARQKCIDHYGTTCRKCGFNFEVTYGQIGKGFIHVHHIKQVASVGEKHEIDPIRDLRPVCANCHAMLHRKRPAYGIGDIKIRT